MAETAQDSNKFSTLIEINELINSDYSDAHALLTRIIESATRLIDGEASSLLLVNPENKKLYFEVATGSKAGAVQKFSLNMGEGIAGWVAEHNRGLIVNNVDDDPRFFQAISQNIGFKTTSIIAVPMRIRDRCVGVIEVINKRGVAFFNDDDLQWLGVFSNQAALAIQNARSFQMTRNEIGVLQDKITLESGFHQMVFASKTMQDLMDVVERLASADSSVLILGESGVGKELVAERIHQLSARRNGPFVRVNCAALPEPLLETELFGHVRGAFTDATVERRGRFELADGGTLFLDEIGELPVQLQGKLLRVIQHRQFEKLGANESQTVDVRIIAATNKDIENEVSERRFRADLYYRLNVFPLTVPPLRRRTDDIPHLAEFFLKRFAHETKKHITGFSASALDALLTYSWPGNVRELENAVERAVVLSKGDTIDADALVLNARANALGSPFAGKTLKESVNLFKKHLIAEILEQQNWNQTAAARVLGIQRTYLSRLVKELEIAP